MCDDRVHPAFATAFRVAFGAGIRRDELRHLQARDVDLDYGVVLVRSKKMEQAAGGEWRPKGWRDRRVTYHLLLDWPVPIVQALAAHRDPTVTLGYWRDASAVLWGDGRQRFREPALALEPYSGVAVGP